MTTIEAGSNRITFRDEGEQMHVTIECQSRAALTAALPHLHRAWLEDLISKYKAEGQSIAPVDAESHGKRRFLLMVSNWLRAELAEEGESNG